ncbi:hypothetical protein C1Y63_01175 [Corynebacterium sp. 13CS0277]|nr:hypothetical protein C1Y63_01175 [Corynebacterium sp. 13CS0277]
MLLMVSVSVLAALWWWRAPVSPLLAAHADRDEALWILSPSGLLATVSCGLTAAVALRHWVHGRRAWIVLVLASICALCAMVLPVPWARVCGGGAVVAAVWWCVAMAAPWTFPSAAGVPLAVAPTGPSMLVVIATAITVLTLGVLVLRRRAAGSDAAAPARVASTPAEDAEES